MTEFSPEKFDDKYVHYFPELQTAYRNAFERMNDRYDSELIHAIDQQVLNESEPFYDEAGEGGDFSVELPENPTERVTSVVVEDGKLETILTEYTATIEAELAAVFGLDEHSPKV